MLARHPAIAAASELGVFLYVHDLYRRWNDGLAWIDEHAPGGFSTGLIAVLTQEDFDDIVRSIVETTFRRTLEAKETASVVLDKRAEYVHWLDEIERVVDEPRFIHLVRDGRDVASSLLNVGRTYGSWAPRRAEAAATLWRDSVTAGLEGRERSAHWHDVRYEDLLHGGAEVLAEIFYFLGIDPSPAEEIYDAFQIETLSATGTPTLRPAFLWAGEGRRRREAPRPEPKGFIAFARSDTWSTRLKKQEKLAVEQVAGDLLRTLGYTKDSDWVEANAVDRASYRVRRTGRASVRTAADRLRPIARRL